MELGKAVLRRSSINSLFRAVHPAHGLVWTDGHNVFLSPIITSNDRLSPSKPIKLGEFEVAMNLNYITGRAIQSLTWSCDFPGGWCYLCVVQHQKVSIWRVEGEFPKLKLKLVRKVSKQPLPQGCLWNPCRDVLAILTAEQCSLYYRHTDKKTSLSLPLHQQDGVLRSASWSDQGDRIYVASKSTVWLFHWLDIDARIKEFSCSTCQPDGMEGDILTMLCIGQDYVLMTTEIPLDRLCTQDNLAGHLDMDKAKKSPTSALMNLTSGTQDASSTSAQLVLLAANEELSIITQQGLQGVLAPDLLCYMFDGAAQYVVVGSNSQSTMQFFTITGLGSFIKQHDIMLPDNERPKGLANSTVSQSVLILLGKIKPDDSAFPSASNETEYELKLNLSTLYPSDQLSQDAAPPTTINNFTSARKLVEVIDNQSIEKNLSAANVDSVELSSHFNAGSLGTLAKVQNNNPFKNSMGSQEDNLSNRVLSASQSQLDSESLDLRMTGSQSVPSLNHQSKAAYQKSKNDSQSSVKIQNDSVQLSAEMNHSDAASHTWHNILQSNETLDGEAAGNHMINFASSQSGDGLQSITAMEDRLKEQESHIARLRRRVEDLSVLVEEGSMISANNYQDVSELETVQLCLQLPDGGFTKHKFLLDKGRLRLDVLKSVFLVPYLMLDLDGAPIVLTSNIDGFIPLRFEAGRTYKLTSGQSHRSDRERVSLSYQAVDNPEIKSQAAACQSQPITDQNDRTAHIKALIQADLSGNAARALKSAAAARRAATVELNDSEPVKPPRRGGKGSSSRGNSDDSTSASGSVVDVTVAL